MLQTYLNIDFHYSFILDELTKATRLMQPATTSNTEGTTSVHDLYNFLF